MSSTGVRRIRDTSSRTADSILDEERSQIESEKIFTETNVISGNNGIGIANQGTAAGNYLSKNGDIRGGPMGNEFAITTISNDAISVDISSLNFFPFLILNGEGGLDDTLSSITPGVDVFSNQELFLQAGVDNITLTEILANPNPILTPNSADVVLAPGEMAKVVYSPLVSAWVVNWVSSGGGGTGLSEPVILTVNTITPQTLPTTSVVDWSLNPNYITLDRDVEFSFSNLPPAGKYEGVLVIIDVDATGGYASPIWPASVSNPPVIPTTPLTRTSVMLYTIDGGTVVTHATSVGSITSGGANTSLSNLTATSINQSLLFSSTGFNIGSSGTPLNDLNVEQVKLRSGTITANLPMITSVGGNILNLNFPTGSSMSLSENAVSKYTWTSSNFTAPNIILTDTLTINDSSTITTTSGQFSRDGTDIFMGSSLKPGNAGTQDLGDTSNDWNDLFIETIRLQPTGTITANKPVIAQDGSDNIIFNTATGLKFFWRINNVAVFDMSATSFTGPNIILSDTLTINDSVVDPSANGQFTRNGTDVKVFSGGAVRNLSDIVAAANTSLSNLITTSINQSLLPDGTGTRDMGSELLAWRIGHFREIEFVGDASVPSGSTDTQISKNASGNMAFNNAAASGGYLFYFQGVNNWGMTSTALTGDNYIANDTLTINDGSTFPSANGQFARNGTDTSISSPIFSVRRATTGSLFTQLNIVKVDAAPAATEPIGELNFNLFDSPTQTTYARIASNIIDVTDAGQLDFVVRADNSLTTGMRILGRAGSIRYDIDFRNETILKAVSGNIGYFVTSDPGNLDNIGTSGTIQIPLLTNGSPSLNDLNSAFGAFDSAIGYETVDNRLYVRESSTEWSYWTRDGTVT